MLHMNQIQNSAEITFTGIDLFQSNASLLQQNIKFTSLNFQK